MAMVKEEFHKSLQDLNQELNRHPELLALLSKHGTGSMLEVKLAEIAAYCGIVLDGMYSPIELGDLLYRKLVEKRTQLVLI